MKTSTISQELINAFAQTSAKINKLEATRKALRVELLAAFQSGAVCPTEGPWLVAYSEPVRTTISWKEEFTTLARRYYSNDAEKVTRLLAKVERNAPRDATPTITVKANSVYRPRK